MRYKKSLKKNNLLSEGSCLSPLFKGINQFMNPLKQTFMMNINFFNACFKTFTPLHCQFNSPLDCMIQLSILSSLSFIGNDPSPEVLCAPDTGAEGLELNNLAVVNKQIDLRPVVFDIP